MKNTSTQTLVNATAQLQSSPVAKVYLFLTPLVKLQHNLFIFDSCLTAVRLFVLKFHLIIYLLAYLLVIINTIIIVPYSTWTHLHTGREFKSVKSS